MADGFLSRLGKVDDILGSAGKATVGTVYDFASAPFKTDEFKTFLKIQKMNPQFMGIGSVFEASDAGYDQIAQAMSAYQLQVKNVLEGDPGKFASPGQWQREWKAAEDISPGQAFTSGILTSTARPAYNYWMDRLKPEDQEKLKDLMPWVEPEFSVYSEEERDRAFRDSTAGKLTTGVIDGVNHWYADPLNIATGGAGHVRHVRDLKTGKLISSTNVETALSSTRTEDFIGFVSAEKAKGGDVSARLFDHPGLRKNAYGSYIATALADTKSPEEVRDVLGVLYGDLPALRRLQSKNEELAGRLQLMQMEADGLEKIARIGDHEALFYGFDIANAAERRAVVDTQIRNLVDEADLSERMVLPGLFQGERALSFSHTDSLRMGYGRTDFYQKSPLGVALRVVRPAINMAPHKMVDVNRPKSAVQVERFLRKTRAPIHEQDELLDRYNRAITPAERAVALTDIEDKAVRYILDGMPEPQVEAILEAAKVGRESARNALANAERRYSGNMEWSLVKVNNGKEEIHYPIFTSQTQDIVPMVDLDQLHRLKKRYSSTGELLHKYATPDQAMYVMSWLGDRFYRLWKPATLLRPAWPMRVVGDEQLRIIGKLHGMAHRPFRLAGTAEMNTAKDYRPGEKGPNHNLSPYRREGRRPIDEEFVDGEVTEDQFVAYVKRQLTQRGYVPEGYEDLATAYRSGQLNDDEFRAGLTRGAALRHAGYYFDQSDAERIFTKTLQQDGATVDINTGSSPVRGYAVSTRPDLTMKVDEDELSPELIKRFIDEHGDELRKPGRNLGVWIDEEDAQFDPLYEGGPAIFLGKAEPMGQMKPLVDEEGNFRGAGQDNLFGPGVYTTDDAHIALEYTSKDAGARTGMDYWPEDRLAGQTDTFGHPSRVTEPQDIYTLHWKGEGTPQFVDLDKRVEDMPDEVREAFEDALRWQLEDAGEANAAILAADEVVRSRPKKLGNWFNELRMGDDLLTDPDQFVKDVYEQLELKGYAGWTHEGGAIMGDRPHTVRIFFDPTKLDRVKVKKKGLKKKVIRDEPPNGLKMVYSGQLSQLPFRRHKDIIQDSSDFRYSEAEQRGIDAYFENADEMARRGDLSLDVNDPHPVTIGIDDAGRTGVLDGGKRVAAASNYSFGNSGLDNLVPVRFVRVREIPWGSRSHRMPGDPVTTDEPLVQQFEGLGVNYGDTFDPQQIGHSAMLPFSFATPKIKEVKAVRRSAYLDVSHVVDDPDVARKVGGMTNQISAWDIENSAPLHIGGTGEFVKHRPRQSAEVSEEEWRRTLEAVAYEVGEAPKPMDYDALKGAYLGVSEWGGYKTGGAFGVGSKPNQYWDLSSSRGALHNLADHYERDGIHQVQNTMKNWKSIQPKEPGYERAWEVAVNQQIASDPMARQFLQGKSYDEVLRWLRSTKEGIRHRRTLPVRGQNPEEWVGMVEDMVNHYLPSSSLRQAALRQEATAKQLFEEFGATPLPVVHGEDLGNALGNGDFWKWYEDFTGKMFEKLGAEPTDILSRHPYFATMYHAKKNQIIDTMTIQAYKEGDELRPADLTAIERASREFALDEVKKLLYDLAEQSDLAKMLRFISPFYGAWQETLSRWAGIVYENPNVIAKAHMMWDAPNKAGLVYDRNGNPVYDAHSVPLREQVLRLRLPKWATKDLPGEDYIPPLKVLHTVIKGGPGGEGYTVSKGGFNLVAMGEPWWLPGVGPTVQIPVNEIIKDRPDLANTALGKYVMPYGPINTGSVFGDVAHLSTPAAYRRLSAVWQGEEGNSVYANAKMRIYTTEMVKYQQGERPNPPTWDEAGWKADAMTTVWALATWVSPSGVQPISPVEPYVVEYRALMEADRSKDKTAPGYLSPDAIFLQEHGPELFALTGALTQSANSAPATLGSYKASKKYEDLIEQVSKAGSPELAGLLIGAEGAGEFNYSVYQYQLQADTFPGSGVKQRKRFSPTGKIADRNRAAGWIEYRKINDLIENERISRGLQSLNVKAADDLMFLKSMLVDSLKEKNADWRVDYDQVDRGVMERRIQNLRGALSADPKLLGRADIRGVGEYLQLRDAMVQELQARGGATTLSAQENQDLAMLWDMLVGNLLERNLSFQDTYYRYLERDEVSASDRIGAA